MTDVYDLATHCRVCRGPLVEVLDLGEQCLGGIFPLPNEPDPPRVPLVLCRCAGDCGLVQLGHIVDRELLFRDYFYRSGVTSTMRWHLGEIVKESQRVLRPSAERVLDIGCNDGTLLDFFPAGIEAWGIDPANLPVKMAGKTYIKEFFPEDFPAVEGHFDLIYSVACFYDANDPVRFAKSVAALLSEDGLWCLEVASLSAMLFGLNYDSICHEHVSYYDMRSLKAVLDLAGLKITHYTWNRMNGGSLRAYVCSKMSSYKEAYLDSALKDVQPMDLENFSQRVKNHRKQVRDKFLAIDVFNRKIHLLGASTKANTVLQYCGLDSTVIEVASDRDLRKHGRVTPGTRIPIVSEEESRSMRPDVYVTVLGHFRDEMLERERGFLRGGGSVVFLLPNLEEVRL